MSRRLLLVAVCGVLVIGSACARASSPAATTVVKLGADELCRRVPAAAVTGALGEAWQRSEDPGGGCRYQSRLRRTATLTVTSTGLTAEAFRRQAESRGGKVTERDGVLIADYEGDGFGALDELWWNDGTASLVLRADNEVTLEQAVGVVALARQGVQGTTPGLTGTATTQAPAGTGTSLDGLVPTTT